MSDTQQMQLKVGFATDVGRKRTQNQDNFAALPEIGLFIVADGMGGHRGGEIASAMVVDIVPEYISKAVKSAAWEPAQIISESIRSANQAIFKRSSEQQELHGMGTTTTALLFKDNLLTIGHVGDSRCYYFSNECIWQATRDHSLVMEKMRAGLITREQAKTDRMKNVITRSVGFEPVLDVETYEMVVKPGDALLMCSDGLTGMVPDNTILEVVQNIAIQLNDPKRAVDALIEHANRNGGEDNVTVMIIKVVN